MKQLYFSYLLRLWLADDSDGPAWRASLEDPHTRQVISFSSLAALRDYLLQRTQATPISPGPPPVRTVERHE